METNETNVSWRGEIWAGFIRTKNWSSELDASRERLLLRGPRNIRYDLLSSHVQKVGPTIGKFLFWTWQVRRAIRIVHSRNDIPEKLVFQARETPAVVMLEQLRALGYNVQNTSAKKATSINNSTIS